MDLRGKLPADTFQYLINTDGQSLYNGTGSQITSISTENITASAGIYASPDLSVYGSTNNPNFYLVGNPNVGGKVATFNQSPAALSISTTATTILIGNNIQLSSNNILSLNNSSTFFGTASYLSGSLVAETAVIGSATGSFTGSFLGTASWALNTATAGGSGTTLFTASTYQITASWAVNTVNGGSGTTLFTASTYPITASWAVDAVNVGTTLFTASTYPITASWATNAINGGTTLVTASTYPITASWALTASSVNNYQIYTTLTTSSNNVLTCSFVIPNQFVELTRTASYTFTSSNHPASGQIAELVLHISHSALQATSSLSFPASWIWINGTVPTSMTGSKNFFLSLHAKDLSQQVFAQWSSQIV